MLVWESYADFQPSQVHKQTAIWFKPPQYHKLDITEPVRVFLQLQRPSDSASSDPVAFEYLPLDSGRPALWSIRRNLAKKSNYDLLSSILANDAQLLAKRQSVPQLSLNGNQSNLLQQSKNLISVATNTYVDLHKTIGVQTDDNVILNTSCNMEVEMNLPDSNNLEFSHVKSRIDDYIENNNDIFKNNNVEEKTFNEIIKQVVELDEIYADTQARLAELNDTIDDNELSITNQNQPILIQNESFDDAKTYSSLQLAFKNPLQIVDRYDDLSSPIISSIDEEKLPPLPPKRIRRGTDLPTMSRFITDIDMPGSNVNIANSNPTITSSQPSPTHLVADEDNRNFLTLQRPRSHGDLTAPSKKLPPTPCSTLPNPKKRNFFSKIFSRKNKSQSSEGLPSSRNSLSSSKSLQPTATNISRSPSNVSANSTSIHIPLKGTPPNSTNDLTKPLSDDNGNINMNLDVDMSLDLTEAEHYALYTAIAPHATQSEFDETSCYYAPVEGGKILTDTDEFFRLNNNKT